MRDLRLFGVFLLLSVASVGDHLTTDYGLTLPGLVEVNERRFASEYWVLLDSLLLVLLFSSAYAVIHYFPEIAWRYWILGVPLVLGVLRSVVVASNLIWISRALYG